MEHDIAFNIFNNSDDNGCDSNDSNNREPSVYVFGYGSLVWNPGFEYSKCITGCEYFDSLCRWQTDLRWTMRRNLEWTGLDTILCCEWNVCFNSKLRKKFLISRSLIKTFDPKYMSWTSLACRWSRILFCNSVNFHDSTVTIPTVT